VALSLSFWASPLQCPSSATPPTFRLTHGSFQNLSAAQLVPHFGLWWNIFQDPLLLPADMQDTHAALAAGPLLWQHAALLLVHIGLKYGPWRRALEEATREAGLTGEGGGEPRLDRRLLLHVLRACACKMHGRGLQAWGPNVARGAAFHSGGIMWLKHLHIVEKAPSADQALEMGAAGASIGKNLAGVLKRSAACPQSHTHCWSLHADLLDASEAASGAWPRRLQRSQQCWGTSCGPGSSCTR